MRVVDSGSGKPVAAANVRYRAMAREGTSSGHGGRSAPLFDITATSDADGTVYIPPTKFDAHIFGMFGMNTNYENATMTVSRDGYATLRLRNSLRIIPNLDEVVAWEHNGKTVALRPGNGSAEQSLIDRFEAMRGTTEAPSIMVPPPTSVRRVDGTMPQHREAASSR